MEFNLGLTAEGSRCMTQIKFYDVFPRFRFQAMNRFNRQNLIGHSQKGGEATF